MGNDAISIAAGLPRLDGYFCYADRTKLPGFHRARAFRSLVSFRASSKFYFIRTGPSNGKCTPHRVPREAGAIPARHSFATSLLTLRVDRSLPKARNDPPLLHWGGGGEEEEEEETRRGYFAKIEYLHFPDVYRGEIAPQSRQRQNAERPVTKKRIKNAPTPEYRRIDRDKFNNAASSPANDHSRLLRANTRK